MCVSTSFITIIGSHRYREDYQPKAVKFADGILPGEGTSPSGGEEMHSPPPPDKPKEKKLRKKRKVKVKVIKLVRQINFFFCSV